MIPSEEPLSKFRREEQPGATEPKQEKDQRNKKAVSAVTFPEYSLPSRSSARRSPRIRRRLCSTQRDRCINRRRYNKDQQSDSVAASSHNRTNQT